MGMKKFKICKATVGKGLMGFINFPKSTIGATFSISSLNDFFWYTTNKQGERTYHLSAINFSKVGNAKVFSVIVLMFNFKILRTKRKRWQK